MGIRPMSNAVQQGCIAARMQRGLLPRTLKGSAYLIENDPPSVCRRWLFSVVSHQSHRQPDALLPFGTRVDEPG